jgi:hypothetical protein
MEDQVPRPTGGGEASFTDLERQNEGLKAERTQLVESPEKQVSTRNQTQLPLLADLLRPVERPREAAPPNRESPKQAAESHSVRPTQIKHFSAVCTQKVQVSHAVQSLERLRAKGKVYS